jgi:hypothetical protein
MSSLNGKPASWVIREKASKRVLFETWEEHDTQRIDARFYEAVPILEYLQDLNRRIAAESRP